MPAFIDLTGRRFGRWSVVARGENASNGASRWTCRCDCGAEKLVISNTLSSGASKGCSGCMLYTHPWRKKPKHDLARMGFGSLTATEPVVGDRRWLWVCRCECGGSNTVPGTGLLDGSVKSCGCLLKRSGPSDPGQVIRNGKAQASS